ncbi:MAG: helix-turn-helix domain-containing protein [Elusimicrobia bacterium]|nr:helix-turn-helix domain-containing protein [Elusimicrobiota bacterium]
MTLLTLKQTSAMLNIGKSKLYALCETGQFPHVRIGGSIRIIDDDVRRMIRSHKVDCSKDLEKLSKTLEKEKAAMRKPQGAHHG